MTSLSRFQNWREALSTKDDAKIDGTSTTGKDNSSCSLESLLQRPDTIFLMKRPKEEGGLTIMHHLSKVEKKDKTTSYVALIGISSRATPIELDLKEVFQKVVVPKHTATGTSSIGQRQKDGGESKCQASRTTQTVRQIQLVPPCLSSALLQSQDQSPLAMLARATQTRQELDNNQNNKNKNNNKSSNRGSGMLDDLCESVITYIAACVAQQEEQVVEEEQSQLKPLDIRPSSSSEVLEWSNKLHQEFIDAELLKKSAPKPDGTNSTIQKIERKKQRSWDESFVRLVAYLQFYGDCNVPREFKPDPALGEWVKNQRSNQKTLSEERRSKLDSIGFTFCNTQQDRSNRIWESYFEKLETHVDIHGECRYISKRETKEDRALQHWVSVQRQTYKRGAMPQDRIKRLESIGFVWKLKNEYKPRAPKDDNVWRKGYEKLVEFHKLHSHVNVPKRPKSNRPLWEWVYAQRKAYNEQRLPEDKVALMEELGMVWQRDNGQAMRDRQWDTKYKEALAFRELHGHIEVPRNGIFGNNNLLKWLHRQREAYKNEKLAANRIKLLSDLDFDFEGNPERRDKQLEKLNWKEAYEELLAYHKTNGTVFIPENGTATEKRLEKWIAKQMVADTFNDLEDSRKEMLMKLGLEFGEPYLIKSRGENGEPPKAFRQSEVSAAPSSGETKRAKQKPTNEAAEKRPPFVEDAKKSEASSKTTKGRKKRSHESATKETQKKKPKTTNSSAVGPRVALK